MKGLTVRFFAALRMTGMNGRVAKCTNVIWFDLVAPTRYLKFIRGNMVGPVTIRSPKPPAARTDHR